MPRFHVRLQLRNRSRETSSETFLHSNYSQRNVATFIIIHRTTLFCKYFLITIFVTFITP